MFIIELFKFIEINIRWMINRHLLKLFSICLLHRFSTMNYTCVMNTKKYILSVILSQGFYYLSYQQLYHHMLSRLFIVLFNTFILHLYPRNIRWKLFNTYDGLYQPSHAYLLDNHTSARLDAWNAKIFYQFLVVGLLN